MQGKDEGAKEPSEDDGSGRALHDKPRPQEMDGLRNGRHEVGGEGG